MANSYFIVLEGDVFLSTDSLRFKGLFNSEQKAKDAIIGKFKPEHQGFIAEQLDLWGQTQGVDPSYIIKEHELNKWEG